MNRRSQEAANALARRAIEAAERRAAETDNGAAAERLREAAGTDGRLSLDAALQALKGEDRAPFNPFADPAHLEREDAKQRAAHDRLFPHPNEERTDDE